jgi:hypothetical protein
MEDKVTKEQLTMFGTEESPFSKKSLVELYQESRHGNGSVDKNKLVEQCDLSLITNPRIMTMSVIDWGKTMAISNEWILKSLMNNLGGIKTVHTDECGTGTTGGHLLEQNNIDISNNGAGFDCLVLEGGYRVQCKLRQFKGKTPYSTQIYFENSRKRSEKNVGGSSKSSHVPYSDNEFDFVLVSLVDGYTDKERRADLNKWNFVLIPVEDLKDSSAPGFCVGHIPPDVLEKNKLEKDTDWIERFKNLNNEEK